MKIKNKINLFLQSNIKLIILAIGLIFGTCLGSILGYIYTVHSWPQLGSVADWVSGLATALGILLTYSYYQKSEFAHLTIDVNPLNSKTTIVIRNSNVSKKFILMNTCMLYKGKVLVSFTNVTKDSKNISINPEAERENLGILLNKSIIITFDDQYFTNVISQNKDLLNKQDLSKDDISEIRLKDNYGTIYSFKRKKIFTKEIKLIAKIK